MKEVSHLFHLVKRGELDLYKKIIGKFDINIRNDWGQSLLHKAVANGHTEIALD